MSRSPQNQTHAPKCHKQSNIHARMLQIETSSWVLRIVAVLTSMFVMHIPMYIPTYTCPYWLEWPCVSISALTCFCVYTTLHTRIYAPSPLHRPTSTCAHIQAKIGLLRDTHRTCRHLYMCMYILTRSHTHIDIHTYFHTCHSTDTFSSCIHKIHTNIHIHKTNLSSLGSSYTRPCRCTRHGSCSCLHT